MTLRQRLIAIIITSNLCFAGADCSAQALQARAMHDAGQSTAASSKPSPGVATTASRPTAGPSAHSMFDEPPSPASIQMNGEQLSINATNASLSEVIRQVATATGMQVEGNSHDQRVFGAYGPGSPPEVLSALLYDSGYNVIMVGSTADGAPRRLVLSTRVAGTPVSQGAAAPQHSSEEDDEETPVVEAPPPQPAPVLAAPGTPAQPGQPKTPQQMLEELQRMHQGQQPPDLPHDPQ